MKGDMKMGLLLTELGMANLYRGQIKHVKSAQPKMTGEDAAKIAKEITSILPPDQAKKQPDFEAVLTMVLDPKGTEAKDKRTAVSNVILSLLGVSHREFEVFDRSNKDLKKFPNFNTLQREALRSMNVKLVISNDPKLKLSEQDATNILLMNKEGVTKLAVLAFSKLVIGGSKIASKELSVGERVVVGETLANEVERLVGIAVAARIKANEFGATAKTSKTNYETAIKTARDTKSEAARLDGVAKKIAENAKQLSDDLGVKKKELEDKRKEIIGQLTTATTSDAMKELTKKMGALSTQIEDVDKLKEAADRMTTEANAALSTAISKVAEAETKRVEAEKALKAAETDQSKSDEQAAKAESDTQTALTKLGDAIFSVSETAKSAHDDMVRKQDRLKTANEDYNKANEELELLKETAKKVKVNLDKPIKDAEDLKQAANKAKEAADTATTKSVLLDEKVAGLQQKLGELKSRLAEVGIFPKDEKANAIVAPQPNFVTTAPVLEPKKEEPKVSSPAVEPKRVVAGTIKSDKEIEGAITMLRANGFHVSDDPIGTPEEVAKLLKLFTDVMAKKGISGERFKLLDKRGLLLGLSNQDPKSIREVLASYIQEGKPEPQPNSKALPPSAEEPDKALQNIFRK